MAGQSQPPYEPLTPPAPTSCWPKCLMGCVCSLLVLCTVIYFGLVHYISGVAVGQMVVLNEQKAMEFCSSGLDMDNIAYNLWWPGCGYVSSMSNFSEGCGGSCYDAGFMEKMQKFNEKYPSKRVTYPSRKADGIETVTLGGWWLSGDHSQLPENATAPRIVVQHGFTSNSNMFRTQSFAYTLRTLGYDVLVNNFRDHCYSENSTAHIYEWGHAYPMDLLGAWDYAVNDADGKLGGKVDAAQVGLLGFSKGGFITNNAFGLEGRVPAAWVDAPPFTPQIVFAHGLKKTLSGMGIGFMTNIILPQVWSNVMSAAAESGVDLEKHLPEDSLALGPDTQRPIYTVHNKLDNTVPFSEGEKLLEFLKTMPEKYSVVGSYVTDELCVDMDHCTDQLLHFEEYKARLCKFWSAVFKVQSSSCSSGATESSAGAESTETTQSTESRRLYMV
eukprot:gb/GFBE01080965.1/.p1 GENE.gb/GFBE01080965.1/~~gb/GFBE01080965.1/.p1  ORF type:complete len:443 (+),score=110.43 gb/GFBE01080965.1/:1-1329(+)